MKLRNFAFIMNSKQAKIYFGHRSSVNCIQQKRLRILKWRRSLMINANFNTEFASSTSTCIPKLMILGATTWKLQTKQWTLKRLTSKTKVKNIYHLAEVRWCNIEWPFAQEWQNEVSNDSQFEEIIELNSNSLSLIMKVNFIEYLAEYCVSQRLLFDLN